MKYLAKQKHRYTKDSIDCYLKASYQIDAKQKEQYKCPVCGKIFYDVFYWKKHKYWCEMKNDSDIWFVFREEK